MQINVLLNHYFQNNICILMGDLRDLIKMIYKSVFDTRVSDIRLYKSRCNKFWENVFFLLKISTTYIIHNEIMICAGVVHNIMNITYRCWCSLIIFLQSSCMLMTNAHAYNESLDICQSTIHGATVVLMSFAMWVFPQISFISFTCYLRRAHLQYIQWIYYLSRTKVFHNVIKYLLLQ